MSHVRAQESWEAHPFAARALRTSILLTPIAVSLVLGFWASTTVPPETLRLNRWVWWAGLLVVATIVVRLLDVALRRLGPIAMLFKLSLVFPDQTPKRFKSALRGGTVTATKRRIREIQEGGGALEGDDAISAQMLDLIAMLSEHDRMTRGHAERVRGYTELIAKEMGIGGGSLERLRWAALLHDMGKLEVPAEILNKNGRPTDEEWAILSAHPAAAERHLAPIADWLGEWRHAADGHHEKWDGSGYPRGLAGTDIPLAARIVAVADAYDVMTSTRSYKKPMSAEVARREISDNAGTQFDPAVARAFLAIGLGDLRRVGGPVAWFASLPAVRQIPIGSVAQPIATGIVATATTISAAVVNLPEEPAQQPPAIAFADEDTTTTPPPPPETTVTVPATATPTTTSTVAPPPNVPPTMNAQTIPLLETTPPGATGARIEAVDPDGPLAVRYSLADGNHPFRIDPLTGELFLRDGPVLNQDSYVVVVTASDGLDETTTLHTVAITSVNGPPTIDDRTGLVREDAPPGTMVVVVPAVDPDNDPLTFDIVADGVPFDIGEDGTVTVSASLDFEQRQAHDVPVRVTDTDGNTASSTVRVIVLDVNEPPIAGDQTITVDETATIGTAVGLVPATDPENATLGWELLPTTAPLSISASTGTITVTGPLDHETTSSYDLRVRVSDPEGAMDFADVTVIVNDVNEPPNEATIDLTIGEGGTGQILIFGRHLDPEGGQVTVLSIDSVTNGVSTIEDPDRIQFVHNGSDTTSARVEYTVADGQGNTASGVGNITVTPVNDPPAMLDQALTLPEDSVDGPSGRFVVASDTDGPDALTFTLISTGTPFSLDPGGELLLDDADALDHEGTPSYALSVEVDDGDLTTAATITVSIADVNEPPSGPDQLHQAPETGANGFLVGTVPVSDPEGDPITVSIAAGTNINPDGDGNDAYSATLVGSNVEIRINDSDDVDHGVGGQAVALGLVLEDDKGNSSTVRVDIATQTRFGLSPHFGEVIISEVDWSSPSAEFVELINVSGGQVDMANWTISDYAVGIDPPDATSFVGTIPNTVTGLDPGQRVLFWPGTSPDPQTAGVEFEGNQGNQLLRGSDDVWLMDENGRIVAYVAWGTDTVQDAANEIGDRPPLVSWDLWDVAYESNLGSGPDITSGQSLSLALTTAAAARDSACWEPTTNGQAAARCAGANLTQNLDPGADDNPNRVSSPGRPNY